MQFGTKKLFSLVSAFVLVWLALRFLLPLFAPFLLGLCLALASEPMVSFLNRRLHVPRPVSAGVGVSMAFCILAMALLLICAFLIKELRSLAGIIPDLEVTIQNGVTLLQTWLLKLSSRTPSSIQPLLRENINALFSNGAALVDQAVRYVLGFAGNMLSHIPDSALTLGTTILSGFMISAKLPRIRTWLLRRCPKERIRNIFAGLKRMKQAIGGWLMAQVKLMGVTFGILLLGFWILRIENPLLWALGVSLVDAFPVLGTGTVLLPWTLICLLQGDTARAVGLAGIYVTVSLTRSALEPKLVGRHLGLDPLVTLIVLYAGFKLWGIGGMLLAPLLTVTAVQALPDRRNGR